MSTAPIVVGYDGSACADAALERAIELSAALEATLIVAFALEPPNRSIGDESREYRKALTEIGTQATSKALEQARTAGVSAEAQLVDQAPAEGLLEVATRAGAQLVVVGTTGERPLRGMILGSVPYKLLHRASVPVLVVPLPTDR